MLRFRRRRFTNSVSRNLSALHGCADPAATGEVPADARGRPRSSSWQPRLTRQNHALLEPDALRPGSWRRRSCLSSRDPSAPASRCARRNTPIYLAPATGD